jgi:hypothetical protein
MLFSWLKAWDQALYRRIQEILGKERSYLSFGLISFAIKTPSGWLGFVFELDRYRAASWEKRPTGYRQHLHGQGGTRAIFRLMISDVNTDDYSGSWKTGIPEHRGQRFRLDVDRTLA